MKVLLVHAHPDEESFSRAVRDRAVAGLDSAGHDVRVLDLCALGFRADMTEAERLAYETEEPILDEMVRAHAEMVLWCEALVFVYPTWWWGLPAILKGWLERVLVPGVAFTVPSADSPVRPTLRQIRRIVGITTYGSPRAYMLATGDNGRSIIKRSVRMLVPSWSCRSRWIAMYAMDRRTATDRAEFLHHVERRMAAL